MVRFSHQVTVQSKGETNDLSYGSLAILQKSGGVWKIVSFAVDDLLNLELFMQKQAAVRGSAQSEAGKARLANDLLTLQELNKRIDLASKQSFIDYSKILKDMAGSGVGVIPGVGDLLSNTYTVYDIFSNFGDIWSDIKQGNYRMPTSVSNRLVLASCRFLLN